ncbi:MAG: glycoside hydrolase family 28 protein [Anaerolineae bacterium]|nr:glycoside hydrolase family 28 protein [Anaerolineae bacterium]
MTGPCVYNVRDYGATGDGRTIDTRSIQACIDACASSGGGTVWVPSGVYLSGSLFLHSFITLHLDAGARLMGSADPAHYPIIHSRWEGVDRDTHAPLLGGSGLEHIAVTGRGIVDGQGEPWWNRYRDGNLNHPRPRLISFQDCQNVRIEGITACNSPSWTITPLRCENVTIDGVTINNPHDSPNTDGINPDSCRNVRIANCHIDVGDDCVTIKSGTEATGRSNLQPCENVTITNCTMLHGHGGVVIGSEMSGSVRNVVISNCVFDGTDRGIRFKSRRGRGGVVEDVRVSNIVMRDVLCPVTVNLFYAVGVWGNADVADRGMRTPTDDTPLFRRIHISQVTATGAKLAAGFVIGLPERPVEDFSLSDVAIVLAHEATAGFPEMADGLEAMERAGLYVCNVTGLRLHNVSVTASERPALFLSDTSGIDVFAFDASQSTGDGPVIRLHNVAGILVHHSGPTIRNGHPDHYFMIEGDRSGLTMVDHGYAMAGLGYPIGDAPAPGDVTTRQ